MRELLTGRRRSFAVERRYMHADGRVIHALVHASLMHGDGERPLYFLCQLVDVSDRRRAEAERRAGEARLQAIIDSSPTLISVKDLQKRYLLVNRRWEELYGISAEQALGRTGREVGAPDADTRNDELDDEVAAAGARFEEMTTVSVGDEPDELALFVVSSRCATPTARSTRSARSRPTSPSAAARPTSASSSSIASRRRSGWRASASSRAASRTTSTTCSR